MRHDNEAVSQGMGDKVVVGDLQEGIDRGSFVALAGDPCAYLRERGGDLGIRLEKE